MTHLKMLTHCLGDTIASSPLWDIYSKTTNEKVVVTTKYIELFSSVYPHIEFREFRSIVNNCDKTFELDSFGTFNKPLQEGFWATLNLPPEYKVVRPKVAQNNNPREIKEKYICIAIQSTLQGKYWNYPDGWNILIRNLKHLGYRVICIDKYNNFGVEGSVNLMPTEAEDFTGRSLYDTISLLQHCEFFVGLTSGLSWLAHAVGKHVVMISGITMPWCEFTTDITRIINTKVCHGCFNKPEQYKFDPSNWFWCPAKENTSEHFICTRAIDPYIVLQQIFNAGIINENRSIDRGVTRQIFNFANKSRANKR